MNKIISMKIIAKNCSLVFQTVTTPEPEVVEMTQKPGTTNRLVTQIYAKSAFENYRYYISDADYINFEMLLEANNNSDMSSGSTFVVNWTQSIDWATMTSQQKSYDYYRIVCREKTQATISPSDVTLYKIAE